MSTETKTIEYTFKQGINRESTQYAAEGGWYDGNRVRFRDQKPENIRGWAKESPTSFIGTARDLHTWTDLSGNNYVGIASEHKIYIYSGGNFNDITPIQSSATNATGNTTAGSKEVVVTAATHGLTLGRRTYVIFNSATGVIGGNVSLSGNEYLASVIDADSFKINFVSTADATSASAGAFGIDFLLQSGVSSATQGYGYGAGSYGRSTWNSAVSSSTLTIDLTQWSLDNFGEDLVFNNAPRGKLYIWDASNGLEVRGIVVSSSPTVSQGVIISPVDRHALCLGCNDLSGNFDPLLVRWSDQEDIEEWVPSVSTTSGSIRLGSGTTIKGAVPYRNMILVFTDRSVHGLEYVGQPYIFTTRQLGDNCGAISRHGVANFNGIIYWMSNGTFFSYDGVVKVLPCTVLRYVFNDLTSTQRDKIFCGVNSEFGEITWLYPTGLSEECNRYVTYSPAEGYWTYGDAIWTAWEDKALFPTMLTAGVSAPSDDSYLYDNEPEDVYTGDGSAIGSFIETGEFDLGDGDDILFVDRIIPDFLVANGSIELTVKSKDYPNDTTVSKGPFNIGSTTKYVYTRSRGRQSVLRIDGASSNVKWRFGTLRMDVAADGKR